MKKRMHWLLLLLVCCAVVLPGCRRKPIETETQTETETRPETESETEKKTEKSTEKKSEKQSETKKPQKVSPNSSTNDAPQTPGTNQTQNQSESTAPTEAPAQKDTYDTCPYCGGSFSTTLLDDGTSEYSSHVAQEEAYVDYINGTSGDTTTDTNANTNQDYDYSDDGGQFDSTGQYGQCTYCFQWFSTVPDASGYSPYADHMAAEEAYAMQNSQEEYIQCPNCGNWVTQSDYNDHIANNW